jgi:uncharacterized NAD-dependent epimerase/dehydratase family protein
MLGKRRRLAILAERSFTPREAKTAVGVLRYRREEVVAVIDSTRAGKTAQACAGTGGVVAVVADMTAAAAAGADTLLIGIAPQGGELPVEWRPALREALERGWDVVSGLHVFLGDDPELAQLARATGAHLFDLRRPPLERRIASNRAAAVDALVVLTVGTDCNVGKMTTALEITAELDSRGLKSGFVATGQTGMMIADHGVAVDALPADFVAGAVEALVIEAARDARVVVVEGQGALHHPSYSGVSLALLHGACPRALVLCHWAARARSHIAGEAVNEYSLPSLVAARNACEEAARWVHPARVIAVSLNTSDLEEDAARAECRAAERELGVPASDPVRFGAGPIADAIEAELENAEN